MQRNKRNSKMILAAAGVGMVAILTSAVSTQAAVIVTAEATLVPHADPLTEPVYTVATDDLLQTSATLTTVEGNFKLEGAGGETVLTDGQLGLKMQNVTKSHSATGGGSGGTLLVYTLDTATSPGGYNISNVHVYGGWQDQNRDHQKWTVAYSTVADLDTFIDIQSVDYDSPSQASTDRFTFVDLSSDSGPLAEKVGKIQFTFHAADAGYNGYREIDVIGAPVPEPSSLVGLGLAGLGLAARRRRAV